MARITVEDCLTKETNRFALVLLAAKRTKQILHGSKMLIADLKNKAVVNSLREIAAGKVRFMTDEERVQAEELRIQQEEEARQAAAQRQASTPPPPPAPVAEPVVAEQPAPFSTASVSNSGAEPAAGTETPAGAEAGEEEGESNNSNGALPNL